MFECTSGCILRGMFLQDTPSYSSNCSIRLLNFSQVVFLNIEFDTWRHNAEIYSTSARICATIRMYASIRVFPALAMPFAHRALDRKVDEVWYP